MYLILKDIKMMCRLGENKFKQGKKLTRKQREVLIKNGYNSEEWLIERQNNLTYIFVNRETKKVLELEK